MQLWPDLQISKLPDFRYRHFLAIAGCLLLAFPIVLTIQSEDTFLVDTQNSRISLHRDRTFMVLQDFEKGNLDGKVSLPSSLRNGGSASQIERSSIDKVDFSWSPGFAVYSSDLDVEEDIVTGGDHRRDGYRVGQIFDVDSFWEADVSDASMPAAAGAEAWRDIGDFVDADSQADDHQDEKIRDVGSFMDADDEFAELSVPASKAYWRDIGNFTDADAADGI